MATLLDDIDLSGVSNDDITSYFNDIGFDYKAPSDPKVVAEVTAAKETAKNAGNSKLANTLDFILKYGDKALTILTKNGIISGSSAATTSGYSADTLAAILAGKSDATNNAPSAKSSVFNLDFTDPKTLIIAFLVVMILAYFLFFYSPKKSK